ncbi:MAG: hemerythrin domain-containing protein [Sorangiineae bacterium]|nr:hemerythrin domain-containing protein [Polyangiaceae bacterium]MEB2322575.1 hemerythrin domain-containing protein [Sorangiineae bacterium]
MSGTFLEMLIPTIGRRSRLEARGALGLLLDCHARIRRFTALAQGLMTDSSAAPSEISAVAAQVHRYFAVALPLHVQDEEESVLPRLRGRDAVLDQALATMHTEHQRIDAVLPRLLEAWSELTANPTAWGALRAAQLDRLTELAQLFDAHLAAEEAVVLPALERLLDDDARGEIERELRARRADAYAS